VALTSHELSFLLSEWVRERNEESSQGSPSAGGGPRTTKAGKRKSEREGRCERNCVCGWEETRGVHGCHAVQPAIVTSSTVYPYGTPSYFFSFFLFPSLVPSLTARRGLVVSSLLRAQVAKSGDVRKGKKERERMHNGPLDRIFVLWLWYLLEYLSVSSQEHADQTKISPHP